MNRLPITLFWLLVALFVSYVISSSSVLPKQMATHFDGGGMPNGWMSRNGYIRFMLAFGLGVPFFVVGLHYLLARYAGNQFNIPNREYWLAPERRADTLRFVIYHSWWLGCLMLLFILASQSEAEKRVVAGAKVFLDYYLAAQEIRQYNKISSRKNEKIFVKGEGRCFNPHAFHTFSNHQYLAGLTVIRFFE
jgi:Protein of unknown function (DUF1648)